MVASEDGFLQLARVNGGRVGDGHPPAVHRGSLSLEEIRDMITANRIQDPLDRLATVAERYMDFLEREARANEAEKEQHDERMLTPLEASKILRIHVQTVMEWCREKDPTKRKLQAFKIGGNETNGKGGKWLIPREQVDAYLRRDRLINGSRKGGAK